MPPQAPCDKRSLALALTLTLLPSLCAASAEAQSLDATPNFKDIILGRCAFFRWKKGAAASAERDCPAIAQTLVNDISGGWVAVAVEFQPIYERRRERSVPYSVKSRAT